MPERIERVGRSTPLTWSPVPAVGRVHRGREDDDLTEEERRGRPRHEPPAPSRADDGDEPRPLIDIRA